MKFRATWLTLALIPAVSGCKPSTESPAAEAPSPDHASAAPAALPAPAPDTPAPQESETPPPAVAAPPAPAAVNGYTAALADMPPDQPWSVELVPLEKLKIFKEDRAWQWAAPELKPLDLSKEEGKAGLLLRYKKAEGEKGTNLPVPTLDGKAALATGHEGELHVMTATSNITGELEGYLLLGGAGTFTFIWLVETREASLPLITGGKKAAPVSPQPAVKICPVPPPK